ncbi:MAG: zf-HC2 domain-containing protein [Chitinophagales bacterium]
MKCPSVEVLSAYLEDELPETEAALLSAHLAACPRCQAELTSLSGLVAGLAALRTCELTPEDQARCRSFAASPPARPRSLAGLVRRPALSVALALVLSFGAGFVAYGLYQRSAPANLSGSPFQAYLSDHRGYESLASSDPELGEFNVQVAAVR